MTSNKESRSKEKLQEDVQSLKIWVGKQHHFPQDIDNEILTAFVYGTKNLEMAIRKFEKFISYREKVPELFGFSVRDPLKERHREVASAIKMFVLPETTAEGYIVLHTVSNDLSKFDFDFSVVRYSMMCELILKRNPEMKGLAIFCDMRDVMKNVIWKMNPLRVLNLVTWIQTAMPIKLKKIVVYNADVFTYAFVNIVKPFVAKKIFERIRVTKKDVSVLVDFIEQDKLPSDLGGKEQTSDELHDEWLAIIDEHRDWFERTSGWISEDKK